MPKARQVWFGEGVAFLDGVKLEDAVNFSFIDELINITHQQGDGKAELSWAGYRKVSGKIDFNAITDDAFAKITGGAKSYGNYQRIHRGDEVKTISGPHGGNGSPGGYWILLDNIPEIDTMIIRDENGITYKKVDAVSGSGEYSYNLGYPKYIIFSSADNGKKIYPDYSFNSNIVFTIGIAFNAVSKSLNRSVGSFLVDGFKVGDIIEVIGSANNDGIYTVDYVSETQMKVLETVEDEFEVSCTVTIMAGTHISLYKTKLPCQMEIWGSIRTKDLNNIIKPDDNFGDVIVHFKRITRKGNFEIGGEKSPTTTKTLSFEFEALVKRSGDYEVFFPPVKTWKAQYIIDYDGNYLVDYDGNRILDPEYERVEV